MATFLYLPLELRQEIYSYLLSSPTEAISIGTLSLSAFERRLANPVRSTYHVMEGRFHRRCIETTYTRTNSKPDVLHPSILCVSRQIHAEAAPILYGRHIFDFDGDVESVVPFLSDLTPTARSSIKRINIVKRTLPYCKDFDNCQWRALCDFLANNLELRQLGLGVFGCKSPIAGFDEVTDTFDKADFNEIERFEGMEWMSQLVAIKGLQRLDIRTIWEGCPPPRSNALAFFVNFSASIEKGFAEYLREHMLA